MISELRYPTTDYVRLYRTARTVLELADGGTLSTWQADRLVG